MTTVTMTGFDAITNIIAGKVKAIGTTEFAVVAGGSRGAAKNALIARVQAALDRDPWYLGRESKEALRFVVRGLASPESSTRAAAVKQVGVLLLDAVRSNVEKMKNPNGTTFRELTDRYAAFKRRKHGFIHPILKASNDLLGGLRVVVTRIT